MPAHNLPDELMNKHAEFPASGRGMWVTGIGYMLAWGTTVPSDGATGYGVGCKFYHTDGAGTTDYIYINTGDRSSSAFLPLTVQQFGSSASGYGPSPAIWGGSQWADVMNDPAAGFGYFNDYLGEIDVTTADGYVITQVTSGAIAGVTDEDGGVLLVDSAGNASADDGVNVQLTNCTFKPAAGRTIRFEARCKFVDAGDDQYFIGLCAPGTTAIIASGALEDTADKCGFYRHAGSTADKISSITARTSADDATADVGDIVDDTYVKLGFVINGLTSVQFYVNGVLVETGSTAANIPNAVMCLSYVAQCEQTSADAEMSVDWVRILQEGTRS